MRQFWLVFFLLCSVLIGSWACSQDVKQLSAEQQQSVLGLGSSSAAALMINLKSHLQEAIQGNDLVSALEFCTLEALPLTESVQSELPAGVKLKRTSLKFRNPKNAPDSIDFDILEHFAGILAEIGELPKHYIQYVETDKEYRYYQPLTTGKLCLNCHGHPDQMDWDVVASLRENYPQDLAVGYQEGEFRGLIRVSIPENLVSRIEERPYLKAVADVEGSH